jgi:hypothetical protein
MSISDIPRQELCILISNFGRGLCDDPQRCEALLRDYCGTYRREITLLVNAMREQVPTELMSTEGKVPYEILRSRLVSKLEENLAITTEAASWSVDAWAAALDIHTPTASVTNATGATPSIPAAGTDASSQSGNTGTRVEGYHSGNSGNVGSGYNPTEVAGVGNSSGSTPNVVTPNVGISGHGGNFSGSAGTQIRQNLPPAPPSLTPPAAPNYNQNYTPNYTPPPGGSKPNYVLFGILGGVGVLGLGLLVGLIALMMNAEPPEMRTALTESKTMRSDGRFQECIDVLSEYKRYRRAKTQLQLCRLDLAKQYASDGKLVRAIREAKLITTDPDEKVHQQAQELVTDWSRGREIKFRNRCNHPIEIALQFGDPKGSTKPKAEGWWQFTANEGFVYLNDKQKKRLRVLDPVRYFAQSTDGSGWIWEGDKRVNLGTKVFLMRELEPKVDPKDGSFMQTLTCRAR